MSEVQNFRAATYPRPVDPIGSNRDAVLDGWFATRPPGVGCPDVRVPAPQTASPFPDRGGLVDLVHAAAGRLRRTEGQVPDQDRALGRAREAEAWLARVRATILSEFPESNDQESA